MVKCDFEIRNVPTETGQKGCARTSKSQSEKLSDVFITVTAYYKFQMKWLINCLVNLQSKYGTFYPKQKKHHFKRNI